MKKLIASILFAVAGSLSAEIMIIHERAVGTAGTEWVTAVSTVADSAALKDKIIAIEVDPRQRLGESFAVFGGIRLKVETTIDPDIIEWIKQDGSAGVLVFWANLTTPLKPQLASFATVELAQAFVAQVKVDASRILWDERPFRTTASYVKKVTPGATNYTLVVETSNTN